MSIGALLPRDADSVGVVAPAVEIVVPVYNEAAVLAASVRRLQGYLAAHFPVSFLITVADNGSGDGTWQVAMALADELPNVRSVRLDARGRGGALHEVWSGSRAEVLAYMDVDLSTELSAVLPLVAPLLSGHSDLAIGTRLAQGARVVRGPKREFVSRSYNALLHVILGTRFSDAQCGFKAIRADRARELLPLVRDRGWFFDTELLVLAERAGLRIHEVPVDWVDDPDSRVDIVSTALTDLRGVARLARDLGRGKVVVADLVGEGSMSPTFGSQVARFVGIGFVSTIAYGFFYLGLRAFLSALVANGLALLVTAVANTAANRRFTFAVRGRASSLRHQAQGLAVFGLALALTSCSLLLLESFGGGSSHVFELGVLVAANLVATVVRFVLLRSWVFRARRVGPVRGT